MDEKWSIEKLESSNWMTWKFQMKHLLLAKELWGFIDGTEVIREGATAVARTEHQKKAQKALSTLVMAISTSQLYLITSCEKPKDAWDALCNHFERSTLANKLMLKKEYFRMEMKENITIEAHLKKMKELTDKLTAIGAPISEEDQVVTLLGSLPSDYSTLVTALEARADDLTLGYVQQALIHEERKKSERYKLSNTVTTVEQKALMGRQTRQLRCYGCGEIGHYRRECPKRKSPHNAKSAEVKHSDTDTEYAGAFAMSVKFSDKAARWLVDSGASSHMTHRREILTDYKEFENPEKSAWEMVVLLMQLGLEMSTLRCCLK